MTLQRAVIRQKAIDILTAAQIVPKGSIFRAKVWKTPPESFPCLVIFTRTDDQENKGHTSPPEFKAVSVLDFEFGLRGDDPAAIEDDMDARCELLIRLLVTNPAFVSLAERIVSIKTAIDAAEGEYQYFRARVSMAFEYTEPYEPVIPDMLKEIRGTLQNPDQTVVIGDFDLANLDTVAPPTVLDQPDAVEPFGGGDP